MNDVNLYLCAVLIAAGILVHFLKKLMDLENAGTILSPITYVKQKPYTFALAVTGAYLLAAFFYFINQLNEVSAIFAGVACSQAYDSLRARAIGKMQEVESGK